MTKLNKIKSLQDFRKYNIICTNKKEVVECLKILAPNRINYEGIHNWDVFVQWNNTCNCFFAHWASYNQELPNINFYQFKKIYKRLMKKQDEGKIYLDGKLTNSIYKNMINPPEIKINCFIEPKEPTNLVDFMKWKPIDVIIEDENDYDNMIDYLDKQGIKWNSGIDLKYWKDDDEVKVLSFYNEKLVLENGLMCGDKLDKKTNTITTKELFKKFNIEYKKLQSAFEVENTGRITKINNWESEELIFNILGGSIDLSRYINHKNDYTISRDKKEINDLADTGLLFISKEARDKALFKMKIEQKLRTIAERLNNGKKIDWKDRDQEKYYIACNCYENTLYREFTHTYKYQGNTIYFLSEDFLEVAKKEIGEEQLIEYFKGE